MSPSASVSPPLRRLDHERLLMVQKITACALAAFLWTPPSSAGASEMLRPIIMASLVAMLGLLPASFATGLGSDVQRPLATVIVWGCSAPPS